MTSNVETATAGQMPQIRALKRTVQRVRHRENKFLPTPAQLEDLNIPQEYRMTLSGQQFLLYDSGSADSSRFLIFSTRRNLELLEFQKHWYCDGTFKTAPALFVQLFTIHGLHQNVSVPLIFALLPDKSEATYRRFYSKIKEIHPNFNPESMMSDFEMAAVKAFAAEFPAAQQRGCFFHFTQCVWRKIQAEPMVRKYYVEDANFALNLRMILSLAFVPKKDLIKAFEALSENNFFLHHEQILRPIIDYFEDTWIGRADRRGKRRVPKFPHEMWNCFEAVKNNLPKTNNSIEGWHRSYGESVGACHPNIWKFINCLKKEQSYNELKVEQILGGANIEQPRKKYKDCAAKIKAIVAQYENWPIIDYLRGLGHNFNFKL